ncbi:MAG: hypothetical protein AAFV80_17145, partial [Bacteroidota bacterium]
MKHLVLLLVVLCCFNDLWSQEVFTSKKISIRNDDAYFLVGRINGSTLLFRDRVDSYRLHAFDDEMNELFDKKIELQTKRGRILDVIPGANDFTVIYRYFKKGKVNVYAQKISIQGDTLAGATVVSFNPRATNFMKVTRSQDKSKLMLFDTDLGKRLYLTVFDLNNLNVVWDRSFTPPDFSYERDFLDAEVDNKGNAYVILEKDNRKS